MTAAAKHPTQAILEVGVKSLVLVDSNVDTSVLIILKARKQKGCDIGRACISPDYIITTTLFAPKLLSGSTLEKLYRKNASESADLSRTVNSNHFSSSMSLLDGEKVSGTIVYAGHRNEDCRYASHAIPFSMRWFKLYVCNIIPM
ncbi:unnamed protein product [Musa acuminata subsp. malaccensis]|uniref:(wild Malaysian banana) hypothetical protein n=1 Tax=Musa acuminata subsp. malaccensis TaxID=214687 RepID=A0A804JHW0_MUSAM|nr:unnamed protein product [Musa acuminata subsp. malaccensis]